MHGSKHITTAMVLAAGLGTRMRPLTDTMPKPLVRLGGRPLLDSVLDRLASAGIARAVVNVHHFAAQIEAHLATYSKVQILISDERDALLDTGGGVVRARAKIGAEPFLIHNSDSVWIETHGSNIAKLTGAYDSERMDSLLLLAPAATSLGYAGRGDFHLDTSGRLIRQSGSTPAPYVFAGVSIAHPRLFAHETERRFSLNEIWNRSARDGRLYGLVLDGLWMHVGTPEALAEAERAIAEHASSPSA